MSVHSRHCCKEHGCKYGEPDCPVVTGKEIQEFPCECCQIPKFKFSKLSDASLHMPKAPEYKPPVEPGELNIAEIEVYKNFTLEQMYQEICEDNDPNEVFIRCEEDCEAVLVTADKIGWNEYAKKLAQYNKEYAKKLAQYSDELYLWKKRYL